MRHHVLSWLDYIEQHYVESVPFDWAWFKNYSSEFEEDELISMQLVDLTNGRLICRYEAETGYLRFSNAKFYCVTDNLFRIRRFALKWLEILSLKPNKAWSSDFELLEIDRNIIEEEYELENDYGIRWVLYSDGEQRLIDRDGQVLTDVPDDNEYEELCV